MRAKFFIAAGFFTFFCVFLLGCPKNIGQQSNSGEDKSYKEAKELLWDSEDADFREAEAKGIVTYPGGDRVDWKVIEVPDHGKLTATLRWAPPRKNGDLSFIIYDQYFFPVAKVKNRRKAKSRLLSQKKRVKVLVDKGQYYIQIFAPRRSDAGKYYLNLRFKKLPLVQGNGMAWKDEVPKTPILPMLPDAPDAGSGEGADAAPLPDPILAQRRGSRIALNGVVEIKLNKGKKHNITKDWTGKILTSRKGRPIKNGDVRIRILLEKNSWATVEKLSIDTVNSYKWIMLYPPDAE